MVCKQVLQPEHPRDSAAFVEQARDMAATLEERENGPRQEARERLARRSGIPLSLLHSLRYRPPKTIAADIFNRLCVLIERHADDQIRMLQHDIATARARRLGVDDRALREVETALANARELLRKASGE